MLNSLMNGTKMKILFISALMITLFSLAACSSAVIESVPVATKDQQADVFVPIVEKEVSERDELVSSEVTEAYPDLDPEAQKQDIEDMPLNAAYPEPESDDVSVVEDENSKEETNPVPTEEPVQEIKPTPRGNELVATNPSTVNLASGKLQLVELFAFW